MLLWWYDNMITVAVCRVLQTSLMVQKYFPAKGFGDAHVSRSSSLVSLRSQTSSQLQCSGFPPKLNTSAVRGEPFILAYTGIRRNNGSGGIFFSLFDVMSNLGVETETHMYVKNMSSQKGGWGKGPQGHRWSCGDSPQSEFSSTSFC